MKGIHTSNNASVYAELNFIGGFTKDQVDIAPESRGIYVAFACKEYEDHYDCARLVYIGKADNDDTIRKRIDDHINDRDNSDSGKQSYWEANYCDKDEVIVYCYAEFSSDLHDIEAVLIKRNQPEANQQGKDKNLADAIHVYVRCTGEKGLISEVNSIMKLIRGSR